MASGARGKVESIVDDQQARALQKTQAFKQDYAEQRSGVEGSLSALARGHGI